MLPRAQEFGKKRLRTFDSSALLLSSLLLFLILMAPAATADELTILGGRKIEGVVVDERSTGVWFETEPYTAILFPYDEVIRATKWDKERNDALMKRFRVSPPSRNVEGEVILRERDGDWILVKPRIARFVPRDNSRTGNRVTATKKKRRSLTAEHTEALQQLAKHPEPLTQNQLSRLAGPPHRRERQSPGITVWYYELGDAGVATITFDDSGAIEDVFIRE